MSRQLVATSFHHLLPQLRHLTSSQCALYIDKGINRRFVSTFSSRFNTLPPSQTLSLKLYNSSQSGLFDIPELTDYKGFYLLEENVKAQADLLVQEAISPNRRRKLVQVFDDLSDSLCRVADMADFVRVAHPKVKYREAADDACMAVSTIVQRMNTNTDLHKAIKDVVDHGDKLCTDMYSDTDISVTKLFLDDFEKCGIHLDKEKRQAFVELSEGIMLLETNFSQGCHAPSTIDPSLLPSHLHHLFGGRKYVTINNMNSDHPDERMREAAYRAYLMPNEHQRRLLDMLLTARDNLSKLAGYPSYAARALQGSLPETPEAVESFLQLLSDQLMSLTQRDFTRLTSIKSKVTGRSSTLQPWDVSYLTALDRHSSMGVSLSELSSYLSLGACMNGLNLLVDSLYGVTLEVVSPQSSECWHPSVYKVEVRWSDSKEVIGVVYCDFYERADKPPQDCHFTIQCGRLRDDGTYQIPKVVLMMHFSPPTSSKPTLLTPQQMDNLFHEFGHAMHSMLGRTKYQHVSGTRCSTDFAEVPSILMEYFTSDYRVLKHFTSHYLTGEPMPEPLAQQMIKYKSLFTASDTQLQVFYSALDQQLHASHPLGCSAIDILSRTQTQFYGLPYIPNTAWHLRFGHLVGYGAKYFSYLLSRAIAAQIWQHCFKDDPLSRTNGERYMTEVLQHGGEKAPADMVHALTGTKPTMENLVESLIEETIAAGHY